MIIITDNNGKPAPEGQIDIAGVIVIGRYPQRLDERVSLGDVRGPTQETSYGQGLGFFVQPLV